MRKILPLFLLLFAFSLHSDWISDLNKYLGSVPDIDSSIRCLKGIYPTALPADKPFMSIILAYLHFNTKDHKSESYWLSEFFENYSKDKIKITFLSELFNVDINDYYLQWRNKYPSTFSFSFNQSDFPFTSKPLKLSLSFQASSAAAYKLYLQNKLIYEGDIAIGSNSIDIPIYNYPNNSISEEYIFDIISPSITVHKLISISQNTNIPNNVLINKDNFSFKDKPFQAENIPSSEIVKTHYFDKKLFFKRVIPDIAVSVSLFAVNQFIFHPKLSDAKYSTESEPFYYSINKTFNVMSIGFSVKGIFDFIKCFKSKSFKIDKTSINQEAVQYNTFLRKLLDQTKANAKYTFSVAVKVIQ